MIKKILRKQLYYKEAIKIIRATVDIDTNVINWFEIF